MSSELQTREDRLAESNRLLQERTSEFEHDFQALRSQLSHESSEHQQMVLTFEKEFQTVKVECSRLVDENNRLSELLQQSEAKRLHSENEQHEALNLIATVTRARDEAIQQRDQVTKERDDLSNNITALKAASTEQANVQMERLLGDQRVAKEHVEKLNEDNIKLQEKLAESTDYSKSMEHQLQASQSECYRLFEENSRLIGLVEEKTQALAVLSSVSSSPASLSLSTTTAVASASLLKEEDGDDVEELKKQYAESIEELTRLKLENSQLVERLEGMSSELQTREDRLAESNRLLQERTSEFEHDFQALRSQLSHESSEHQQMVLTFEKEFQTVKVECSRLVDENNRLSELLQQSEAKRLHSENEQHEALNLIATVTRARDEAIQQRDQVTKERDDLSNNITALKAASTEQANVQMERLLGDQRVAKEHVEKLNEDNIKLQEKLAES